MRRLGIYEKTPSKKKKYQPTEWITEKFPEEKVQIDVKFVQKEYMSPELQEKMRKFINIQQYKIYQIEIYIIYKIYVSRICKKINKIFSI